MSEHHQQSGEEGGSCAHVHPFCSTSVPCSGKQSWSGQVHVTMNTKNQKRRANARTLVLLDRHQPVLKQTKLNCGSTTKITNSQARGASRQAVSPPSLKEHKVLHQS